MKDTNMGVIVGRLVRDAELSYSNGGSAKCKFSVCWNRSVKKGDAWEDEPNFADLVVWGKQGEAISKFLRKGRQVSVTFELRQNRWEKDGEPFSKLELVVNQVQLLSAAKDKSGDGQESQSAPVEAGGYSDDDDIPF